MTRLILLLSSCATLFAQRTPLKVNGTVVDNPNFTNSATLTWTIVGANIRGTAAGGGGDTIWTNDNGTISATSTNATEAFKITSPLLGGGNSILTLVNGTNETFKFQSQAMSVYTSQLVGQFGAGSAYLTPDSFSTYLALDGGNGDFGRLGMQIAAGSGYVTIIDPTVDDGSTPYQWDTSTNHTSGNLMEVKNNGNQRFSVDYEGAVRTGFNGDSQSYWYPYALEIEGNALADLALMEASDDYFNRPVFGLSRDSGNTFPLLLDIGAPDGTVPFNLGTTVTHTSGNIFELKNNVTNKISGTWDGVVNAVGGFSSTATDAAVTISATGWTNTFGKNAVLYLDGIGLTFKVYNNAGTPVYTNSVALAGDSVLLQPSGKLIITGGTLGVGRATPF